MDITFHCPNCNQNLAADTSGAGSQIDCPACGQLLTIPAASKTPPPPPARPPAPAPAPAKPSSPAPLSLKVPVGDKGAQFLIAKPKPPLEVVQKGAGKKLRIHTIRRAACMEGGHDKFDERVSAFLNEVTETYLIEMHPINYEHFDVESQKVMTDYGVLIFYRA